MKGAGFKVDIRSQDCQTLGIRNIDVCVTDNNQGFPNDRSQCFLHGFDFSGRRIE